MIRHRYPRRRVAARHLFCLATFLVSWAALAPAQVTYERILQAEQEPGNWLTYAGTYKSQHYSSLGQISQDNVKSLAVKWVFQARSLEGFEVTPLVVDGVMYITQPPNDVLALDAETGRVLWHYEHQLPRRVIACCGLVNRGLAILGDKLYMGTLDARLLALDTKTGTLLWDVEVADYRKGYSLTLAPLVVKDKVIVGPAGGEFGIRGFLDAYDAETGERAWRFYTIPGPGQQGHETWEGESWKTRWRPRLGHRFVRRRAELALLGHRESQPQP